MDTIKDGLELRSINSRCTDWWWISKRTLGNWTVFSISADTGERTWAFTTKHLEDLKCLLVPHGWKQGCPWKVGVAGACFSGMAGLGSVTGTDSWVEPSKGSKHGSLSQVCPPWVLTWQKKTQKDKWDELIASSVIPLAAAGMFWNYRLFFSLKICSSLWFSPFYELIFSSWIISRIRQE